MKRSRDFRQFISVSKAYGIQVHAAYTETFGRTRRRPASCSADLRRDSNAPSPAGPRSMGGFVHDSFVWLNLDRCWPLPPSRFVYPNCSSSPAFFPWVEIGNQRGKVSSISKSCVTTFSSPAIVASLNLSSSSPASECQLTQKFPRESDGCICFRV